MIHRIVRPVPVVSRREQVKKTLMYNKDLCESSFIIACISASSESYMTILGWISIYFQWWRRKKHPLDYLSISDSLYLGF